MATCSSVLAWKNPMARGAWQAAVYGSQRGRHYLEIQQLQQRGKEAEDY